VSNNEARIKLNLEGDEQAIRKFLNVGQASKKAGDDIASAFKAAGAAVATFGASVLDAVVDVGKLDPVSLTKSLEDYSRSVTRMAISTGQSVQGLTAQYTSLARANAVMPQQIDAFAKSLSRLTYDAKGAIQAYTGMHEAALAFNETDQDQIPFAAYLKNVQRVGSDTREAFSKLKNQANELGTVGGPRALRDLYVSVGNAIEEVSARTKKARGETEAFVGVITRGLSPTQAKQVAGAELGFLEGNAVDIMRTLGYDPFDRQGKYKNPVKVEMDLYARQLQRGMSQEQIKRSFIESNGGPARGIPMYYAVAEGRLHDVAKIAGLKGDAATSAIDAYKESSIGHIDQGYVEGFISRSELGQPLVDLKAKIAETVNKHPIESAGAAWALKKGVQYGAAKVLPKVLGLGKILGSSVGQIFTESDVPKPESEQLAEDIFRREHGGMAPLLGEFAETKERRENAKTYLQSQGINPSTASVEQMAQALQMALERSTVKVQVQETPATQVEADKSQDSRN
jgi:hypothetical protein